MLAILHHFEETFGGGLRTYTTRYHGAPPAILEGRHSRHDKKYSLRDLHVNEASLTRPRRLSFEDLFLHRRSVFLRHASNSVDLDKPGIERFPLEEEITYHPVL